MTFIAKTKSPDEWKAIVSAISTLVDEATFEASVEGISFRGMDPSHVALIDIFWPNSAFEKYECDSLIKFGVRIDEFSKLIKRAEKKDSVQISIDNSLLLIKIQNGYKKDYKMRLIESSSGSTPLPKLNFNSKILLSSTSFDRILSDIQVLSEYITIDCKSKNVRFLGKGDSGEADIELNDKDDGLEELVSEEDSSATYSIDYLIKITKAVSTVGGSVTAEYSSKMPLRLEFPVSNIGRIHFYLAPRVQD
ncbi:MAG: proliferating cell nuclear antigen (pcna) [Nitrososphaeraceae archaeon]